MTVETPVLHTDATFDASITYDWSLDNWDRTAVFVNGVFATCIDRATDWGFSQDNQTDIIPIPVSVLGIANTPGTYTIQTLTEPTNGGEATCAVAQGYFALGCPLGFCPSSELTVLATGTFTVSKDFSDDNTADVDVAVTCSDYVTISGDSGTVSESADFVADIQWDAADAEEGGPTCTATETPVVGYTDDTADACTDIEIGDPDGTTPGTGACTLVNTQDPVTVYVDKVYSEEHPDGVDPEVDITLTCDSATVNDIAGSATATTIDGRAEFTVSDFLFDGSNCFATEFLPAGYVQDMTDDSCGVDGDTPGFAVIPGGTSAPVDGGGDEPMGTEPEAVCTITNDPTTATFSVEKDFSDDNPLAVDVLATCADDGEGPGITVNDLLSGDTGFGEGSASEAAEAAFVIKYLDGSATCSAAEVDDLAGYTVATADGPAADCATGQAVAVDTTDAACEILNDQDPIVIEASKVYTDAGTDAVDFAIECTNLDTGGSVTPATASASPGSPAEFTVTDVMYDGSTTCTVTEPDPPAGYAEAGNTCTADNLDLTPNSDDPRTCEITNGPFDTRSTFRVTKFFADGNNVDEVTVSIDCNTGLILDQDKDLEDGEWVEFVVTDYTDGTLDCTITEDDTTGYAAEYYNVTDDVTNNVSCEYLDVTGEDAAFECEITNTPLPVDVVVSKDWIIEGLNNDVDQNFELDLYCTASGMTGPGAHNDGDNDWHGYEYSEGDDTFTWQVVPLFPTTSCHVEEYDVSGYVEVENGCQNLVISAGTGASCTVTNTVFFEGIPTLSQYGMALMALLMLGVGFVSFRRFS